MTVVNGIMTWPCLPQLAEHLILAYVEWREESAAVWRVYDKWASASAEDKPVAHAAYCEALDREESAANAYEALTDRTPKQLDSGRGLPPVSRGPHDLES